MLRADKGRNDAGILQLNWQRIDDLQVVGIRRRSGRMLHGNGVGDRISGLDIRRGGRLGDVEDRLDDHGLRVVGVSQSGFGSRRHRVGKLDP